MPRKLRDLKHMQYLCDRVDALLSEPQSECEEWPYGTSQDGYGRVWNREKFLRVHRVSLERKLGRPLVLHSLHHCDNILCFNPSHLFEGSDADNVADKVQKKRGAVGARHGCAKLTDQDVRDIRKLRAQGVAAHELAQRFSVTDATISLILSNKLWSHLEPSAYKRSIDTTAAEEIRKLYQNGLSQTKIAKQFGVSQMAISRIVRCKTWTHI